MSFNNIGITDDSHTNVGGFDGANTYSAQALAAQGITPGGIVAFNGVKFTWPNVASGTNDNYVVGGQVLPLSPPILTKIAFLGAAIGGATSGTATLTYTDGTTQTFTLGMSDWSTTNPSFGNQIVATCSYRNTPTGQDNNSHPSVLYAEVIPQSKSIQSVTLPSTTTGGQMHIFAVGVVFPPYQPGDTLVGPIVHQLSLVAQQVAGVTIVYEQPPDGPPEDGSVSIPLNQYKIKGNTNAKLYTWLSFGIHFYIRRGSLPENITTAYSYVMPFLQAFSAWGNQSLNGLVQKVDVTMGGVTQFVQAGQVFSVLVTNVDVLTEFNIPTS